MQIFALTVVAMAAAAACRQEPDPPVAPSPATSAIEVGGKPADLAAGDVDGDGHVDLVCANGEGRTISVRLQRDGKWIAAPGDPLVVELDTHLIALADLDLDRDLDLVGTGHDSGAVHVWLGDGTGRFASAPGSPFTAFETARPHNHGLALGDVDGDRIPDVVVADQEARAAAVLLGDGRGGLRRSSSSPIALGGQPYPLALGDIDRDGRLDLVAPLIGDDSIAVMLGDGAGGFVHARGSPHRTGPVRPYAIALADLDRDGALDVIASHDDSDRVSVLLGDGQGVLREAEGSPVALGLRIWRMSIADIDGDRVLDLAGAGSGSLIVLHGDGRGGLVRPRVEPLGEGWSVVVADLDRDGRADMVAPDSGTQVLRIWFGGRR